MENKPQTGRSGQRNSSMWFMNKVANPLVGLILRSRLHALMSASMLIITYRGRKTGREYSLPVQYAQDGNHIFIVPGMPEQKTWWRNLKGGLPIQLRLRGKSLNGKGSVLDPKIDPETIFEGLSVYLRRFPALVQNQHIQVESDGSFNPEELRLAAKKTVIICVELSQE
ncbi:MAG: nitroreductase/quinone reductase family protein [Anaerolineales bacterium]